MQMKQKLTEEKASMAVYVSIVLFSFLIILTGIYMTSISVKKAQLKTVMKIKESYERYNPYVETIYQSQLSKLNTNNSYVSRGLIVHYDAINNTGNGHSDVATTWKNLAGTQNDGIINGAQVNSNYVRFDGVDDWVNMGQIVDKNTITLEATVKLNIVKSVQQDILCNYESGGVGLSIIDGKVNMIAYIGGFKYLASSEKVIAGQIYHIVGTYDGNSMKLYINGELKGQLEHAGTIGNPTNSTVMAIGTNPLGSNSSANYPNMDVYSIRIYERALNVSEVQQNYSVDKKYYGISNNVLQNSYVSSGLILHYDGINNTGNGHSSAATTWKDLSGKGNDGTLSKTVNASTFYWGENNITLSGASGTSAMYVDTPVNLNGKERTIVYTIDATNLTGSIWGDTDRENFNGTFNYQSFIANRTSAVVNQNKYDYNFARSGIYHYAFTISSSKLELYVNGLLQGSVNNTYGLKTSNNLRILSAYYANQNATNLKVYNFMVYDRVLTNREIQQNYKMDKDMYKF